jgi:hypothetical protein
LSGDAPNLTYAPNPNFNGNDGFSYVADDGNGGLASGTVHIGVFSVQDTPVAQAQSVTTSEDTAVPIVLVATDGDGDPLQYFVEVGPTHGSLSGSAPNLTYTPFSGYNGPDAIEFSVRDSTGRSDRATVGITVTAVDGIVTTLTAKPAQVGTVPPRIVKPLEARLTRTSTGAPLPGKRIEFYVGSTRRCVVTTDLNGTARCRPSPQSLGTASSYEARFLGDNDYAPSSATGTISRVV